MITSLNFLNNCPCKGLVKKSASMLSDGQYSTLNSFLSNLSFTKKYLMLICLEFPVHEFLPFLSISMVLWLSWYKTLSLISYPCAERKRISHRLYGIYSLAPTSSASVELLTFNFCLLHFACNTPFKYAIYYMAVILRRGWNLSEPVVLLISCTKDSIDNSNQALYNGVLIRPRYFNDVTKFSNITWAWKTLAVLSLISSTINRKRFRSDPLVHWVVVLCCPLRESHGTIISQQGYSG